MSRQVPEAPGRGWKVRWTQPCRAGLSPLPEGRPFRTRAPSVNQMWVRVGRTPGPPPAPRDHTSQPGALRLSTCLVYDSLSGMSHWPVCSLSALVHKGQGFVLLAAALLVPGAGQALYLC